ncbi:MAG: hypothetical protein K6U14_12195 [Firmicutes bacterium]|nr:hypothetical protein [Alicyclobacillaceae bacterium]MCL6498372.1 hypothetical protein [Bacillota bacterium]
MAVLVGLYAPNTPSLVGDLGVRHDATLKALRELGETWGPQLDAWVVITPHFVTGGGFGVVYQPTLRQIYDYSGFPPEFYQIRYVARGHAGVARAIVAAAAAAGIPAEEVGDAWGMDHGAWSPLLHLNPEGAVPVVPVSICATLDEETHRQFGRAIAVAAEGFRIGVLATGSLIHRLDLWGGRGGPLPDAAYAFLDRARAAFAGGVWEPLWASNPEEMAAAAPEGGRRPVAVLRGAVPCFQGRIAAEEMEFGAASLTTAELIPCAS